ncbi:hypothetical protein MY8738_003782 [Beauveria namnaoensis]
MSSDGRDEPLVRDQELQQISPKHGLHIEKVKIFNVVQDDIYAYSPQQESFM